MTSYHRLTTAELDAIASGDSDTAAIRTLLSGLYSKRVVLINAVLVAAADRCPGAHAHLEEAYRLLAAAQQADPAAVRTVVTHPSVGIWAARCLSDLRSPADAQLLATGLGLLAGFSAAAAIRANRAFAIEVPVRGRMVFLPTLGLATLEPQAPAAGPSPAFATVRSDGREVTIAVGDGVVTLPPDPARDVPGWQGLRRLRADHGGAMITLELDDLDPDRGSDGVTLAQRLDNDTVAVWQAFLDGAWATLASYHPQRASALACGLRWMVPLEPVGGVEQSGTDAAGFGGIALTQPRNPLSFAETLIHEFHHSVLAAVADLTPLHTAGPDAVHYSPWRNDPRPVEGLLQGAYAYLGVTAYWEAQRKAVTGQERALADFEFALWRDQILLAAQALRESGMLTQAGATIVGGMTATAERWRNLPVAEEPRRLAERAVADHWIGWRLRNHRPDPVAVAAIAAAWQNGEPCPARPDEVPVTVVPRQRLLGQGERTRLFKVRLADPRKFSELLESPRQASETDAAPSAADLDYAADDFKRAASGYRAVIRATPGDIEAWSGLILATVELSGRAAGLVVAPEVALSVYLAVIESTSTAPDLDKLQDWLAAGREGVGYRHRLTSAAS